MPIVQGMGDEVLCAVFVAASSLLLFVGSQVRVRWGRAPRPTRSNTAAGAAAGAPPGQAYVSMDRPPDNDLCSVCHDDFHLPVQANCSHWFCGECIMRVWQHGSVLAPCRCPICRRSVTLLVVPMTHEEGPALDHLLQEVAKYNRLFGNGPVSFWQVSVAIQSTMYVSSEARLPRTVINTSGLRVPGLVGSIVEVWGGGLQRCQDMPMLLRRLAGELADPARAFRVLRNLRIIFFLLLMVLYVISPIDLIPESVVGLVGLLDDLLLLLFMAFHVSILYRTMLLAAQRLPPSGTVAS